MLAGTCESSAEAAPPEVAAVLAELPLQLEGEAGGHAQLRVAGLPEQRRRRVQDVVRLEERGEHNRAVQ